MSKNSAKQLYECNQEWLQWARAKKYIPKKRNRKPNNIIDDSVEFKIKGFKHRTRTKL